MKKAKYKSQSEKDYILKVLSLLLLIFIFFLASKILAIHNKATTLESIDTIKEVIEYYESYYISEEKSNDKDCVLDVKLRFKKLSYDENNNSNEEYYNNLIEYCAKVIFYENFRLIDAENQIIVKVICEHSKVKSIIINDIEDYFIYMDSKISLEKYKETVITDLSIESAILQECIANRWKQNTVEFGTKESIFNKYYIYFEEGIRVRSINGKIYNIIFNSDYKDSVINGITPGTEFDIIKNRLGKPTFENSELNIIGYKSKNLYIFFDKNEISVYRNTEEETDNFFKLADDFISEKLSLTEFMNELTYIWPDYSDYLYDSNYLFISYPLKGIEIKINYDDTNGILVYNNIKTDLSKIGRYLANTYFISRLQLDLVFIAEERRIEEEISFLQNCDEYKKSLNEEKLSKIGENENYDIYPIKDSNGQIFSIRFISKNNDVPNREINDGINDFIWYGNYFIYSKTDTGIFIVDMNTGVVKRLVTGKEKFSIYKIEDGKLKYDNKEIVIQY